MRTAADLAAAIPGGVVKESTIQNVEAGRKAELTVSQLLNIAFALRLPPAYLLAPLGNPDGKIDLAYLSDDLENMKVVEFENWLSGNVNGAYSVSSAAEHRDRNQLQALRELEVELRERKRLSQTFDLERGLAAKENFVEDSAALEGETEARLEETNRRLSRLVDYLESAGWNLSRWIRQ